MAHRPRSLELTGRYQARLLGTRDKAVAAVASSYRAVDLEELASSYRAFTAAAVNITELGQAQAVNLTDGYFAGFLSSELGERIPRAGLEAEAFAGTTRDGRPISSVLGLGLVSITYALGAGMSDRQALDSGLARVVRAVRTEVMDAGRSALAELMRGSDRVSRFQRVVQSSNPCGACLALDGSIRSSDTGLETHASCSCTAEPIVDGLEQDAPRITGAERFDALDEADQDALFAGRGGADKAELIRSGEVPIDELVTRQTSPDYGETIFETPLTALH